MRPSSPHGLSFAIGLSAVIGTALFAGCSSNILPHNLVAGGAGGDDCCFGPSNTATTTTASTSSGPVASFCDKWAAQCPNDGAMLGLTLDTCKTICEMGKQYTLEPCWFAECSVETMQCAGAQPGDPAINACAIGHGWEPGPSSTSSVQPDTSSTSSLNSSSSGFNSSSSTQNSSSSGFNSSSQNSSSSGFNSSSSGFNSSSTGGPGACDNQNNCGGVGTGCIGCAEAGACLSQTNACSNDPECGSYVNCITACAQNDQACLTTCQTDYPNGANEYAALGECVICQECPVDCDGPGSGC